MKEEIIRGQVIDVFEERIFPGEIHLVNGMIKRISEVQHDVCEYILPGFVDAHIHIESSMLVPSEFAKIALQHGTIATVSDPHEIANVLGIDGIEFMIASGKKVPVKFFFGAPSCVPATTFETSGSILDSREIERLIGNKDIWHLSEVMNYPDVINGDEEVTRKIRAALQTGIPIDGHAPGLRGADLKKYVQAGISTDHECFTLDEALEKISYGMKVLIREGSAAKNFQTLHSLINSHNESIMLCSDDLHPDDLLKGHINLLVIRAINSGIDIFKVLRAACVNPVIHYGLPVGMLRVGDPGDFLVVDNLKDFSIQTTYINGSKVFDKGINCFSTKKEEPVNNFIKHPISLSDLLVPAGTKQHIRVINIIDEQLITTASIEEAKIINGFVESDLSKDILKLVVINRYIIAKPSIGFVKNFGLEKGALASTICHDCHNLIAIGTNDEDLFKVISMLQEAGGGIGIADGDTKELLELSVGGIMSTLSGKEVAANYQRLDALAKVNGTKLKAPFMTLSFLGLLVIPELKLSDKGLFNSIEFRFEKLFV